MSLFVRIREMVTAHSHHALDEVERPHVMAQQLLPRNTCCGSSNRRAPRPRIGMPAPNACSSAAATPWLVLRSSAR
jgi:hypothetical protein